MNAEVTLDRDAVVAFAEQVGANHAITMAALAYVGDRLGLWTALAATGSVTSREPAERTGLAERHLLEWLAAQAAAGYHDAGRFTLTPEPAAVLADAGPAATAGCFERAAAVWAGTESGGTPGQRASSRRSTVTARPCASASSASAARRSGPGTGEPQRTEDIHRERNRDHTPTVQLPGRSGRAASSGKPRSRHRRPERGVRTGSDPRGCCSAAVRWMVAVARVRAAATGPVGRLRAT